MTTRKLNVEQLEDRLTPSGFPGKELVVTIDPPPKFPGIVATLTLPAQAAVQVVDHNPNADFAKPIEKAALGGTPQKEILVNIDPPPKFPGVVTTVSLPVQAAVEVLEHNPNAGLGEPGK